MSLFLPCSYSQFIGVSYPHFLKIRFISRFSNFSVPFSAVMIYTYYHGIIDHSGITFKKAFWQPWQPDCIFHDNHHQYFHVNFGFNIELWDKVKGREKNFFRADSNKKTFSDLICLVICFRSMVLTDKRIEFTARTSFMATVNPSVMLLTRSYKMMWRKEPQKILLPIKETNYILNYPVMKSGRKRRTKQTCYVLYNFLYFATSKIHLDHLESNQLS